MHICATRSAEGSVYRSVCMLIVVLHGIAVHEHQHHRILIETVQILPSVRSFQEKPILRLLNDP